MAIIKDPALEPFYIGKDAYCYTVYEVVTPDPSNVEEGKKGKVYEKPVGHYADFGKALLSAAKAKLNNTDVAFESVSEYLQEWERIQNEINQLIDFKL